AGPAAGEALHLASQAGEVGARARAVLEDPRLVVDQVEDRVEVVAAALDEAGGNLWSLVGVLGDVRLAAGEVDGVVAAAALDPVLVPQPAVEPDRAVESAD